MPFYWNWVLSKCYGAFSYTLNFDNSTVVGFDFGSCWHHTVNKILFLYLFCVTDTNSSTCVSDDVLKMVVYNDLYFEVFFFCWMLDCSVCFLDCCVGLIWKRLTLYVCSSVSNAVPSSCLSNLHILWHALAICLFLLHLEHVLFLPTHFSLCCFKLLIVWPQK